MDNTTLKTVSVADVRSDNDGMVLTKSEKTGAGRISIQRQKQFVDAYKKAHPEASTNGAKREYEKYRVEHARTFNARIAAKLNDGSLLTKSASVNKSGHITGVQFLTARDASATRVAEAQIVLGKELGLSEDAVRRIIEAGRRAKKQDDENVVEVKTEEVKTNATPVGAAA